MKEISNNRIKNCGVNIKKPLAISLDSCKRIYKSSNGCMLLLNEMTKLVEEKIKSLKSATAMVVAAVAAVFTFLGFANKDISLGRGICFLLASIGAIAMFLTNKTQFFYENSVKESNETINTYNLESYCKFTSHSIKEQLKKDFNKELTTEEVIKVKILIQRASELRMRIIGSWMAIISIIAGLLVLMVEVIAKKI